MTGGVVRDLLLSRPMRDLDLVVAGDGIAFARRLAQRLGASIREHPRFGTAALTLARGAKLDVASTRRETYSRPGALPAVATGASIEEDLARRDFTVNAMALELAPGEGWADPFGGVRDLERAVVRELHPRSFVDDPTRAFRAVRYANRLGFRIPAASRRHIAAALAEGALGNVSGDRIRRELRLILEEEGRGRAVATLIGLGVAGAVDPALAGDARTVLRLRRSESLAPGVAGSTTWLCYLLAWMGQASDRDAERVADRLAFAGAEGRALRRWPEVRTRLAGGGFTKHPSLDELVAAASGLHARERRMLLARAWARAVSLAIRGSDLVEAGVPAGPAVGAALARTLAARQAGRIGAQEELSFALAAAREGSG